MTLPQSFAPGALGALWSLGGVDEGHYMEPVVRSGLLDQHGHDHTCRE